MNKELLEILEENTLRVESILSIGGMQNGGSLKSELEDFFEDTDFKELREILPACPDWLESEVDNDFSDGLIEWLEEHNGYLVRYGRPVMRRGSSDGAGLMYSWGCYNTRWFYGETVEATVPLAAAWAEKMNGGEEKT
jgi:hypothetical protein